jgi:oligopeptide/dipeptide ABC transporter ATP-binding protein
MRQRVVIAISIACRPEILICDEPTTALDVTIQAQILQLIKDLQKEYRFTTVYITHDLGVVANVADFVAVMYSGKIIEYGMTEEIFYDSRHPYTWALLSSLPQLGNKGEDLYAISGTPPNLFKEIRGDAFAPRNPQALDVDFLYEPPMIQISETHRAATWLLDKRAPSIARPEVLNEIQNISSNFLNVTSPYTGKDPNSGKEPLLSVKDLKVQFKTKEKELFTAVKGVSFDVYKGETFGLVGESGSGKTTIGRTIIRLNPSNGGSIKFNGERIDGKISREMDKKIIKGIQMIFQDPMASLNERAKVDYIISEGLHTVRKSISEEERKEIVGNVLSEVGLLPEFASRFPHEFSGGQRQRIGIARTLVMEPGLIIADEPISALDVSIRAQVLNLLSRLKREKELTYLFIAHDLSIMRFISDRIGVIYCGELVELAETEELFRIPLHPYTKALISAIPQPDPSRERSKEILVYNESDHNYSESDPPRWFEISPGRWVRANRAEEENYRKQLSEIYSL